VTHHVPARVVRTLALVAIIACLHFESRTANLALNSNNPVRRLAETAAAALPMTAQAQISAAVGRDEIGFHGTRQSNHVRIENPSHGLTATFTATEVQLATPVENWRLTLTGYGYPKQLRSASGVIPDNVANRVEYQRAGMTEWYVNGPMGIEQGFTFANPPGSRDGDPLTVQFALSGDLVATTTSDRTGLTLTRRNGTPVLKYRGLTAHDSTGRELTAWLEVKDGDLSLLVDDSDARYPVVVDPFIEQVKLSASDGASGNNFGAGVAIHGDTIVVGAPNAAVDGRVSQGAAYVFVKPAGGWSQVTGH
jgi:FG-GAP repeat protein